MRITITFILITLFVACNLSHKKTNSEAQILLNQLKSIRTEGILFGHHDALAYGIGWKGEYRQSDVKKLTGDYPVVFGWDLADLANPLDINGVPFDSIKSYIKLVNEIGGVNTLCWHAYNPINGNSSWETDSIVHLLLPGGEYHHLFKQKLDRIAIFMEQLVDENGKSIPFIFRPWHEMDGGWFWWGADHCSSEDFKSLFRFTIEYLKQEKGITNMLVCYSPDRHFNNPDEYLKYYPGDDIVDILAFDDYGDFKMKQLNKVIERIEIIVDVANEKGKLAAMSETGNDRLEINEWYTSQLLSALMATDKTKQLSYVMVWRNHDKSHFYVPYPGHEQADDFIEFTKNENILLLSGFNNLR